jgi:predicted RNase H-like HicB family nuclease
MRYSVIFEPIQEPGFEGYYYAHIPALDLTAQGEGIAGALTAAQQLLKVWITLKRARGEAIPVERGSVVASIEVSVP